MNNSRSIIYLLTGILILIMAHVYLSFTGEAKLTNRETILDKSMIDADLITIEHQDGSSMEIKKTGSVWNIEKPFWAVAEEGAVARVLDFLVVNKIQEKNIYTKKELEKSRARRIDLGLDKPKIKVCITKGDISRTVFIGNKAPSQKEVFAAVEGDDCVYVLDVGVLEVMGTTSEKLRSKNLVIRGSAPVTMFDLKRPDGALMRFCRKEGQWMSCVEEETGRYTPASNIKIEEFLNSLAKAKAEDFIWPIGVTNEKSSVTAPMLAGYGLDVDRGVVITIRDKTLSSSRIVIGNDAGDGFDYALVQNEKALVKIDGSLRDLVMASDFSDTRLFPSELSRIDRVALIDAGVDYRLAKNSNGKWVIDSPIAAVADEQSVKNLIERILKMTVNEREKNGVSVSIATNIPAEKISRTALLEGFSLAGLRTREIAAFEPSDVRRIVATAGDSVSSVAYDTDKRIWVADSLSAGAQVRQDAVKEVVEKLKSLNAVEIVTLKATESELKMFGLDKPACTIAVDFFKENSLRRNIFIGERTSTGYYATMGAAFDAVVILSDEDVVRLTSELVISAKGVK